MSISLSPFLSLYHLLTPRLDSPRLSLTHTVSPSLPDSLTPSLTHPLTHSLTPTPLPPFSGAQFSIVDLSKSLTGASLPVPTALVKVVLNALVPRIVVKAMVAALPAVLG